MTQKLPSMYECQSCFLQSTGGLHAVGDRVPKYQGSCDECGAPMEFIGVFPERQFFNPYFWMEREWRLGRLVDPTGELVAQLRAMGGAKRKPAP